MHDPCFFFKHKTRSQGYYRAAERESCFSMPLVAHPVICTVRTYHSVKKKKKAPCAARDLASTVLKLGSTTPISDTLCPIAIATASETYICSLFGKARSSCAERIASYFDPKLIFSQNFFSNFKRLSNWRKLQS